MYISEDKAAAILHISCMQLRFILEEYDYLYKVEENCYYIHGSSLNKLEKDIKQSQSNFKSILEEHGET